MSYREEVRIASLHGIQHLVIADQKISRKEIGLPFLFALRLINIAILTENLSTLAEQSENNFTWTVTKVNEIIEDAAVNDNLTREQLNLIHTYMRFGEDGLTIGKAGNPLTFRVVNDRLAFYMNDTEVAYLSDNKLYVTQAEILARLQIGKFAYEPQPNGNLSVIYTG